MTNQQVAEFIDLLKKWWSTFTFAVTSTVTTEDGSILAGRTVFGRKQQAEPPDITIAGLRVRRSQVKVPPLEAAVEIVKTGRMTIAGEAIRLECEPPGGGFHFYLRGQNAAEQVDYLPGMPVLRVSGAALASLLGPLGGISEFTRGLQTSDPPYDDLFDLYDAVGLRSPLGDRQNSYWDICLVPPIALYDASLDPDGMFTAEIDVAVGADLTTMQLGLRVLAGARVLQRLALKAQSGVRRETDSGVRVRFEVKLANAREVDLILAHEGAVVSRTRLVPAFRRQRANYVLANQIDPQLRLLRKTVIDYLGHRDRNSRAFEGGLVMLLSLSGLRVTPLCAFPMYGQSADICATAPGAPLLIIEASTQTILSDTAKIELLADRAEQLRLALQAEGLMTEVVPVFATPYPRDKLGNGLTVLEQHSVALLEREQLENLFSALERGTVGPVEVATQIASAVPISDPLHVAVRDMTWALRANPFHDEE